jgi:outer membrane protein assembly factor BamB
MRTLLLGMAFMLGLTLSSSLFAEDTKSLRMVIMDPLAKEHSCPCVAGYAQRNYRALAEHLEKQTGYKVEIAFNESLTKSVDEDPAGRADIVIGKHSVIVYEANKLKLPLRPSYALSDLKGSTSMSGWIVVTKDDPAQTLKDLAGYQIIFGPEECDEKYAAAFAAFKKAGITPDKPYEIAPACGEACSGMLKKAETGKSAAVISSYAAPLVEGCGTIPKGSIRVVAKTDPVPFIEVFLNQTMDEAVREKIKEAFEQVATEPELLKALESLTGFDEILIPVTQPLSQKETSTPSSNGSWTGWRGPTRDAIVSWLPASFDQPPKKLWSFPLSRQGLGGVAADTRTVYVTDRDPDDQLDLLHAVDIETGQERWRFTRPAAGRLDYGNNARATPMLTSAQVMFLGAHGHLDAIQLETGKLSWGMNIAELYGLEAKLPWGYSGTPVLDGKTLIASPGGVLAGMAAFDTESGDELWATESSPPAYGSYVILEAGGKRQIVGVDSTHVRGFDAQTGEVLWEFTPESTDDFQVPTPIVWKNHLILVSETMGTRLHRFDEKGHLDPKPVAVNFDLSPDTHSPVVIGDRLYGINEVFLCLDLTNGLKEIARVKDDRYGSHTSLIASGDRLLVFTHDAQLQLFDVTQTPLKLLGRHQLLDGEYGLLTHPAIVKDKIYVRGSTTLAAFQLLQ